MATPSRWLAYGWCCRQSAACNRDASSSASAARSRSAAGNCAISISRRSRRPTSPCTEVIVCSGIPASSRRSAGSSPMPVSDISFAVSLPRSPPSPQARYAWYAACSVMSGSSGRPAMIMPGLRKHGLEMETARSGRDPWPIKTGSRRPAEVYASGLQGS